MKNKTPTVLGLTIRLLVFVVSGFSLGALSIMAFYRLTLQATVQDQLIITQKAAPISGTMGVVYLVLILLLVRPLFRFVRLLRAGQEPDETLLAQVQHQALSLGPKMALLAFFFYLIMTPLVYVRGLLALGWPWSSLWFAILAGLVAGLLLVPLALNLTIWIVQPILDYSAVLARELPPARRAGVRLSLRAKLLLTFLPLITSLLLFTSVVGYSQTEYLFENFQRLEQTLSEEGRNQLVDRVSHKTDPGIRSSRFFQERLGNLKFFFSTAMAAALGLSILLSLLFAWALIRPVQTLFTATLRISEGDPQEPVRLVTNDEMAELGATINRIKDNILQQMKAMAELLEQLAHGVRQMDETATSVMAVSAEQASGATEQATAVQETVSIAEEIVATARQIQDKAKTVDSMAAKTLAAGEEAKTRLDLAETGFQGIALQTEQIREAMRQLEHQFAETFKIVEWMEEIAEQTELLALNAALEAASAGGEGRRFQVVAEATRRLANRSREAVQEVRTLVQAIQEATRTSARVTEEGKAKVSAGGQALQEIGQALRTISTFARETTAAAREITISTSQQSSASEQLAASIAQISQVAEKVEAGAKETEAAIAELRNFSESLRQTLEAKPTAETSPPPEKHEEKEEENGEEEDF